MTMVQQRQPFPDAVAERVIQLLRAGTAPWQQRHGPGEGPELPMNPANGNRYKGINAVQLMSQGRDDPRWLTYDQAQELGAQVRPGEQGTRVQFWKLAEERQKSDNGRPVTDSNGDPVMERVPLERPRAMTAVVFNAEQIDGMPPLPQRQQPSEAAAAARVQALLEGSGAKVRPVDGTNAYYRAASDTLQMPPSAEFASEASRAATVLRELAHWTGHESRLGRDLSQPYGSAEHAKEQLRAELAALFMGEAMEVGQEPANPGAYTDAWVHLIQEDPLVLLRAAAQAEQIQGYVLKFDQGAVLAQQQPAQVQAPGQGQSEEQVSEAQQQGAPAPLPTPTQEPPAVSTAAEENARINAALAAVQQQSAPPQQHQPRPARTAGTRSTNMAPKADPEGEFAQALRSMGCLVPQGHPKMDGQPYRVPVTGDRGGQKSGFYVGHLDGLVPAGYIKNNRTGQETRWKAKGYNLTDEQRNRLQAEAAAKLAQRRAEEARRHEATAQRVSRQLAGLRPVDQPTPYLRAKGVQPHPGAFTDAQGKTTFLPAIDKTGKHWTTQYIGEDGIKRFAKDGHKEGCFHVLGGMEALKRVPVIVMGEGYATMATIKEAVGHATVAAFDSGNLPSVARAMRELFPTKPIIVAGDDDQAVQLTQGFNPGREKAEAAAAAVGGRAIFPVFAPGENTYPATQPPVTPATYRAHANASELLARGGLTAEATQALQADLLKPGQISALEQMKKHTDFNDLAQKSVLGREALLRQVLPEVKQAQQIHHAEVQKQAQEQSQRQAQGVRQRQGHGLRAG